MPNFAASFGYSLRVISRRQDFADIGQSAARGYDIFLVQNIAHGHLQHLGVFEAVQNGLDIFRPAGQLAQVVLQGVVRGKLVEHQAVHQLVDHARVADQDARQVRAGGAQLDVHVQRRGIEAEQFPQHAFAAERFADLAKIDQRLIGIGRVGDRLQQARGDAGEKVPAAPRGKKSDVLFGQRHQIRIGAGNIVEAIVAQHPGDLVRLRIGIEHQIDFRFRLVFLAEGIVQQVVENSAIQFRLLLVIDAECVLRGAIGRIGVAHANGQSAEFLAGSGQQVRLQIEHDLQAMLDFSQEGVVFLQEDSLLVRQAAADFQLGDRFQRVAGAQFRQVAAVEQLQKLDGEFDVADAAQAGFDVLQIGALAFHALLDSALERLDAGDVGAAQIAAINPRLELLQEFAAQIQIAGRRTGFHKRLPFPSAAQHVVVLQCAFQAAHHRPALPFGA